MNPEVLVKHKFFICLILLFCFNISLNYPFYSYSNTSAPEIPQGTSSGVSFRLVGQVGGPTQAVAVRDSHAYVGIGMRMVVLDVSSHSSIQQVGETSVFDAFVTGVWLSVGQRLTSRQELLDFKQ